MTPFNYETWKQNPSRKVVTENNVPVKIIYRGSKYDYPLMVQEEGKEDRVMFLTQDGRIDISSNKHHIFFADEPEKQEEIQNFTVDPEEEMYVNRYPDGSFIYSTLELAIKSRLPDCIGTYRLVKVETNQNKT